MRGDGATDVGRWIVVCNQLERIGYIRPPAELSSWRKMWSISVGLTVVVPLNEAKLSPGLASKRFRLRK